MNVSLYATLRQIAGTKAVELPVQADQTVGDVLHALVKRYPSLKEAIWYEDGSLAGHVAVILNGRDIRHLEGVDSRINESDQLAVFPPVGGGEDQEKLTHITLKFTSHFRARVGKSLTEFAFKGSTLRHFITALLVEFDIADLLLKDDELKPYVRVVINGRFSYLIGGWEAETGYPSMLAPGFSSGSREPYLQSPLMPL